MHPCLMWRKNGGSATVSTYYILCQSMFLQISFREGGGSGGNFVREERGEEQGLADRVEALANLGLQYGQPEARLSASGMRSYDCRALAEQLRSTCGAIAEQCQNQIVRKCLIPPSSFAFHFSPLSAFHTLVTLVVAI